MNLSYSQLSTYQQCPRKYKLSYVDRIKKIEEAKEDHHRKWGEAVHAGLEAYYKGSSDWRKAVKDGYPVQLDDEDRAKTLDNAITLIERYIEHYAEQDKNWEVKEVEVKDQFEVNGVAWEVHIDLIAENKQGGGIYFWDHKTTGKTPTFNYWNKFEMSAQIDSYTYYIEQKYGQCSGAYINALVVGYRQRMWKGELAGFWCKFERNIFNRSKRQLKAWQDDVNQWHDKIGYSDVTSLWPRHMGELCSYCTFRELCLSADDEQIRETMYQKKEVGER